MSAQQVLRFHREEVSIHHRRWFDVRLRNGMGRQLDGEATRLPYAAFHFLDALREVRVTGIQIAPRVDDRDHRLPAEILARVTHLQRARAMAERAEVFRA